MKYIRTKNGIEEIVYNSEFEYYITMHTETIISEVNIGKYETADTIEELLDEFVVKHIIGSKPYVADEYQKTQILKDRQKTFFYDVEEVYGAIYTNKGLIYVAKLNDKGEFELL